MKRHVLLLSLLCITISVHAQNKWQLIPHLGGNITKLFGHEKSGSAMGKFVELQGGQWRRDEQVQSVPSLGCDPSR